MTNFIHSYQGADFKFFLTASLDVRAKRWGQDEIRQGKITDFEKIKHELEVRDQRDKNREVAPLCVPKDAVVIDNSDQNKEETLASFLQVIQDKESSAPH